MPNRNESLLNMLASFMQPTQAVSTDVVEPTMTGHDSINNIMNEYTMSQMPERQIVGGVGTGLDALTGFTKAASLIPAGSKKMMNLINEIIVKRGLVKSSKKSFQQLIDAAKKEGVDYGDMISRHSNRVDELKKQEGALQLSEEWLKLFGTPQAKSLSKTESRLIDFLR